MKITIDQWAGAKGIGFRFKQYCVTLHPHVLADFRIRKYYPMRTWKEYFIFGYKNRRLDINEWDLDLVFLGFMIQIQKYKSYMVKTKL